MKKLLGIVVLGLFLSNNAFANIKYIKCTSFELIAFKRSGEIKKDLTNDLEYLFEIDNKNEIIAEYMSFGGYFQKLSDVKWTTSSIQWHQDDLGSGHKNYSKINRLTGEFTNESYLTTKANPVFRKIISKYNCKIIDKKF